MLPMREIARVAGVAVALAVLPISGAVLAHGKAHEAVAEFSEHMDAFAGEIEALIASVGAVVAGYKPGEDYAKALQKLVGQWESLDYHQAVETNATPLYPPVWAALGAFSDAIKKGEPLAAVQSRADDITAALWQGYGALKLLAIYQKHGQKHGQGHGAGHDKSHDHEQAPGPAQADGEAAIDTINKNLDQVLVLYKEGKKDAARDLVYATYMQLFEGIEGDLIEQDAELVAGLEADFNASLPNLIKNDAPAEEVAAQINAMRADLEKARGLLAVAEQQESSVF